MSSARALAAAGLLLALATVCGAFGAHALKGQLSAERLQLWDTAVRYHFFQALGLIGVGLTQRALEGGAGGLAAAAALRAAGALIVSGIILFSGSLYALALTGVRALGAVTPFGGVAFIAGWIALAIAALRGR